MAHFILSQLVAHVRGPAAMALEHDGRVIASSSGMLRRRDVQNARVLLLMLMHVDAEPSNLLLDRRQDSHDGRQIISFDLRPYLRPQSFL